MTFAIGDHVTYRVWRFRRATHDWAPLERLAVVVTLAGDEFTLKCCRCDGAGKVATDGDGRERCRTCQGSGKQRYTVRKGCVRVATEADGGKHMTLAEHAVSAVSLPQAVVHAQP